jgi:predicted nuclease of restriction endonuclease-like RecB superfamily
LNAEFKEEQGETRAFLSDQCKEIEENNRMGKTRGLKKIRATKGTFHAKMGTIKGRNKVKKKRRRL